jgi:hypothetical protein
MKQDPYLVTPVPLEHLPSVWADVEAALGPALETAAGKVGLDDVFLGAAEGNYAIWLVLKDNKIEAVFTTRVALYPKRRALVVDWVGGKGLFRWIDVAMNAIRDQAVRNQCLHVEGYGRTAWARALKRHNFVPEYVAYRMELTDGQG